MHSLSTPGLIFSLDEIDELRLRCASSHARFYKPLVADLRSRLDSSPPDGLWDLPEPDYSDQLEICFSLVVNAGIAYHLSQKDPWAGLAGRWLEQWVAAGSAAEEKVKESYLVAFHAMALAYGLDLFGPVLDGKLVAELIAVLRVETERMVLHMASGEASWSRRYYYHDCWVPVFGAGIGCLALLPYEDQAEQWLKLVAAEVEKILSLQSEDGAWNEGVAPLNYALGPLLFYLEGRRRILGEEPFDIPWLRGLSQWRANHLLPNGQFIFLDDSTPSGRYHGETGGVAAFQFYKIAREFGDGLAQWQAERESERKFPKDYHDYGWSFLWCDPKVPTTPLENGAHASFHPSLGQLFSRFGCGAETSVLSFECVAPGGRPGQEGLATGLPMQTITRNKHAHYRDRATFSYFCQGEYFFPPSGYFRFATEFKNTLTIDGKGQSLAPESGGRMAGVHLGDRGDYVAAKCEAALAYDAVEGLGKFDRTVVHLADDQMLFVLDQLAFSDRAEHKVEAHFHVGHEMSVCVDREGGVTITAPSRRSCRLVQVCGQPSNLEQVPQPLDPFWRNYLMDYDIPPQDLEAMDQVDLRFEFGLAANYSSESLWAMLPANIDELNHLSSESGLYFWYNSPGNGLRLVVAPNQWGQAEAQLGPELPARPETIYVAGGSPGATIQLALEPRAGDRWVAVLNAGDAYRANEAGIVSL